MSLFTLGSRIPRIVVWYTSEGFGSNGVSMHRGQSSRKVHICDFFGYELDDVFAEDIYPRRIYTDEFHKNRVDLVMSIMP